ncbi:hypothetical protein BOTBODRAFT_251310 [Botryobasidium botryosum FD-172 SS1]|uniref:Uncharacterized protein n=1 Tax=Botryobasidium botryosum (strain FD-172 SS1) TaxID=930990 RepID=A0A067MP68_BOTB1|nr:hypothetical protein BOTBODRAFT_251310 [Botryobasidium botryosum FD-172 SS1]
MRGCLSGLCRCQCHHHSMRIIYTYQPHRTQLRSRYIYLPIHCYLYDRTMLLIQTCVVELRTEYVLDLARLSWSDAGIRCARRPLITVVPGSLQVDGNRACTRAHLPLRVPSCRALLLQRHLPTMLGPRHPTPPTSKKNIQPRRQAHDRPISHIQALRVKFIITDTIVPMSITKYSLRPLKRNVSPSTIWSSGLRFRVSVSPLVGGLR